MESHSIDFNTITAKSIKNAFLLLIVTCRKKEKETVKGANWMSFFCGLNEWMTTWKGSQLTHRSSRKNLIFHCIIKWITTFCLSLSLLSSFIANPHIPHSQSKKGDTWKNVALHEKGHSMEFREKSCLIFNYIVSQSVNFFSVSAFRFVFLLFIYIYGHHPCFRILLLPFVSSTQKNI